MIRQLILMLFAVIPIGSAELLAAEKRRVIVTTDGEIDDECSMVRFLLYANDFDVEGIITSSSQYHAHGHKWAGDDWVQPYLDAYARVYSNLIKHDRRYPTPEFLRARTLLGNVKAEGIHSIEKHGLFEIDGDASIMESLDSLLKSFVKENRMKISGEYTPCYHIIK